MADDIYISYTDRDGDSTGTTSDITQAHHQNLFLQILLLAVTFGLYTTFWMLRQARVINRLMPDRRIETALIWVFFGLQIAHLAFIGLTIAIANYNDNMTTTILVAITFLLWMAVVVYQLVLSFTLRGAFNEILKRTSPSLSPFGALGTFLFTILYLQHRLNQRIRQRNEQAAAV